MILKLAELPIFPPEGSLVMERCERSGGLAREGSFNDDVQWLTMSGSGRWFLSSG